MHWLKYLFSCVFRNRSEFDLVCKHNFCTFEIERETLGYCVQSPLLR